MPPEPLTAVTDPPEDFARPEPVPEVALHLNAAKMLPFQFEFAYLIEVVALG